jgi:hypothetical protein
MTSNAQPGRRVILAEFNEITYRFIDPLVAAGKLPNFSAFLREGARGAPVAPEEPLFLDPWIAWTTLYTGRPQEEHGVKFLEQPPETVTGPRIWEMAADAGRSVGVYGSIMSWPPRTDVRGFWVPSTFSPTTATHPQDLAPIQDLNIGQTRAHTPVGKQGQAPGKLRHVWRLFRLGLRISTLAKIVSFLVRSRLNRHRNWEKVGLQPLVNLDFFEALYDRHQPDLATFHTNHAAHYMHRYWRAADSTPFLTPPSEEERRHYGRAVEYGYDVADQTLGRLWRLADDNTVVIVASGLGQQPYVSDDFRDGREIVRIREIKTLLELCGIEQDCTPISMMAPQWNLDFEDPVKMARAQQILGSAWVGSPEVKLFAFEAVGKTINFNVYQKNLRPLNLDAMCVFPDAQNRQIRLGDLCAVQDATPKQGCHDRVGVLMIRGAGIRRGARIEECSTLDIAPTMLHLMGLPIPEYMRGRVLEEALVARPQIQVPALAT